MKSSIKEYRMKLILYKLLTIPLIMSFIAIILFLTIGNINKSILTAVIFIIVLAVQVTLIKCPNCGTRPGIWLLAIWTLLLDYELYFADTVMLRECPKCKFDLKTSDI